MSQPELFVPAIPSPADCPREQGTLTADVAEHRDRIRCSALWAAYGDALGWVSELTDDAGLKRRTGGEPLHEPIEWRRRIGGRGGITTEIPKGCYSDDSQLRLATGRAIGFDGFDVEAFAKVELPVWLSYALGGGISTTSAAEHLAKTRSPWFANRFKGWTEAGGNGAAMRVQPHVWTARDLRDTDSFLVDVVRNAICTHSHPTGIMGAVLHALCIAHSLVSRDCPSPSELGTIIDSADRIPDIVSHDAELGTWRSAFDRESGSFDEAWKEEVRKTREAVRAVGAITTNATARERYRNVVNGLQLRDPARRGSGMLTAVAATALAWCERSPAEALRLAANAVGTDTDTIATMAGAILGAVAAEEPPVEVLDAELFRSEADRMAKIAEGDNPPNHRYPDLLHWKAPSTRSDALVSSKDGQLVVRGMGNVSKSLGDPIGGPNGSFLWQWIKLELGQTMLIKRRRSLASAAGSKSEGHEPQTWSLAQKTPTESFDVAELPRSSDLRNVLAFVEQHIDNDEQIGRALRRVVSKGSTGQIHEFTGKLIDLLQRARPRLEERNAALVSNVARGEQQIAPL